MLTTAPLREAAAATRKLSRRTAFPRGSAHAFPGGTRSFEFYEARVVERVATNGNSSAVLLLHTMQTLVFASWEV